MLKLKLILILFFLTQWGVCSDFFCKSTVETTFNLPSKKRDTIKNQDSIKMLNSAKKELYSAKKQGSWKEITLAYKRIMYFIPKEKLLPYADSMLVAANKAENKVLIGSAYLKKGIIYYDRKDFNKALDNYLKADALIAQTDDNYSIYKIKYSIAHTKYYLGFYDEAISLFKECIEYFEEENDRAYLNSLHSLGLSYNKLGKYDLCSEANRLGLEKGLEFENLTMAPYFKHSQGVNKYYLKEYQKSINMLTTTLPEISKRGDFANTSIAHFYIGKCFWAVNKKEEAVKHFILVDNTFLEKKYIKPDLRENYELLIKYYHAKKNTVMQLIYINRLLEVDKILNQNYKYLSRKIYKEYDTRKLLEARQQIEKSMQLKGLALASVIVILIAVIFFLVYRYGRNKRLFKKIMKRKVVPDRTRHHKKTTGKLEINPEVVTKILCSLEKFEDSHKYLAKDMNLVKMAALLNSNTKYIALIIYHYRGKKFIQYISDLKIDYLLELLKNETRVRNYTNKALGEEVGFGSTQNFTKAFNQRTGISPSYFIAQLKKSGSSNCKEK